MKKSHIIKIILLFFCLGIISCSDDSDNIIGYGNNEITGLIKDNNLVITNYSYVPIYYFAVEREVTALIKWAPICKDENKINPKQSRKIELDDIPGYMKGRQILVFYWNTLEPTSESIKNILVQ